jgi:hypothetical protein
VLLLLRRQAADATGFNLSDLDLQHILSSQCHVKLVDHVLLLLLQAAEATGLGLSHLDLQHVANFSMPCRAH